MRRHLPPITSLPPLSEAGNRFHTRLRPQQREVRRLTALHEAAHFTFGVFLGASCFNAAIRIPGQSPRRILLRRGALGTSNVHGKDAREEALIYAAGVFVEFALDPENWERAASSDSRGFDENIRAMELDAPAALALLDEALLMFYVYWPAIDGVAAAFLEFCDSTGYVSPQVCGRIAEWVRSGDWGRRCPAYELPVGMRVKGGELSSREFAKVMRAETL